MLLARSAESERRRKNHVYPTQQNRLRSEEESSFGARPNECDRCHRRMALWVFKFIAPNRLHLA